jgi:hypothetical protein
MESVTLHHPDLPGQPITITLADGTELSPEYERAGWVVSDEAQTDDHDAAPDDPAVHEQDDPLNPSDEEN